MSEMRWFVEYQDAATGLWIRTGHYTTKGHPTPHSANREYEKLSRSTMSVLRVQFDSSERIDAELELCRSCYFWLDDKDCGYDPECEEPGEGKEGCRAWKAIPQPDIFSQEPKMKCPDGGTCHHGCTDVCWRVTACSPLSNVFINDEWPQEVRDAHAPAVGELSDERWAKAFKAVGRWWKEYGGWVIAGHRYHQDSFKTLMKYMHEGAIEKVEILLEGYYGKMEK